jgi:hypothetical protein
MRRASRQQLGGQVGVAATGGGPGALGQDIGQPAVALGGLAGAALAPGAVVARAAARPGGQVAGGREDRHVHADLGDDRLGGAFADPGDGVQPVTGRGERGDHLVHARVEADDRALQVLQVVKGQPDQQRMMLAEATPQGLTQLGELGAQPAPGQLRQDLGVAFAGDQSAQHRPARDTQDVGGDRDPA